MVLSKELCNWRILLVTWAQFSLWEEHLAVGPIQHLMMPENVRTRSFCLESDSYYLADAEQKHASWRAEIEVFSVSPANSAQTQNAQPLGERGEASVCFCKATE